MSDEERMDLIQEYINYLRSRPGECPDEETLILFQQGALPAETANEVKAHVDLCGFCLLNLHRLEKSEPIGDADEEALPPDWPEIERRGRERFYAYLESRKKEQP